MLATPGLLHGFPLFSANNNRNTLHHALNRIALINLKKLSGGANADMAVISAFTHRNTELLKKAD